ncbi:hypothetical protein RSal33209_1676 [Renibacterium salmoninarum ATCC 33209]|uniref:Uncharacterized protein n=2 Tax=Renibacterium salmoninarum TaxID=1646 RepID=A9WMV1_RENSM|nr:hypothetical protein RSal33209_1676 [Renibacterium salmoninarum ATCC 33209]
MQIHLSRLRTVGLGFALATLSVAALSGCQLNVPAPEVSSGTSGTPSYQAPTITPGHDAAAVAGKDMDWKAGNDLSLGVPVAWADQLAQATDPTGAQTPSEWKPLKIKQAGESEYSHANGCLLSYWQNVNQGPLMVTEDDKASTIALFKYLMPAVSPDDLKESSWPWSQQPGKPSPSIQFLSARHKASATSPAWIYSARMLNHTGGSLVLRLSCPNDALLDSTLAAAQTKLVVSPPQQ